MSFTELYFNIRFETVQQDVMFDHEVIVPEVRVGCDGGCGSINDPSFING